MGHVTQSIKSSADDSHASKLQVKVIHVYMYIKSKRHLNIKFYTNYNVPEAKTAQGEGLASIPDG